MTRFLRIAAFSFAVLSIPAIAHAQAKFDIGAGASLPTSDLSNVAQTGYNVMVGADIQPPLAPVGFRIEGAWNQFSGKSGFPDWRILSGSANLIYSLMGTPVGGPYLIGGLGVYNNHLNVSGSSDKTEVGGNVGAGFRFGLSGFSAFAEARYHYQKVNSGNASYIPITFGLTF